MLSRGSAMRLLEVIRRLRAKPDKKVVRSLGCDPEFMKDALHGALQVQVVAIDGSGVLPPVVRGDLLSGGEEGFDGLVAKDEQGGDRPQTGRKGLIATRRADPADDLFTAELLQIVGCLAGTVVG